MFVCMNCHHGSYHRIYSMTRAQQIDFFRRSR